MSNLGYVVPSMVYTLLLPGLASFHFLHLLPDAHQSLGHGLFGSMRCLTGQMLHAEAWAPFPHLFVSTAQNHSRAGGTWESLLGIFQATMSIMAQAFSSSPPAILPAPSPHLACAELLG